MLCDGWWNRSLPGAVARGQEQCRSECSMSLFLPDRPTTESAKTPIRRLQSVCSHKKVLQMGQEVATHRILYPSVQRAGVCLLQPFFGMAVDCALGPHSWPLQDGRNDGEGSNRSTSVEAALPRSSSAQQTNLGFCPTKVVG